MKKIILFLTCYLLISACGTEGEFTSLEGSEVGMIQHTGALSAWEFSDAVHKDCLILLKHVTYLEYEKGYDFIRIGLCFTEKKWVFSSVREAERVYHEVKKFLVRENE